MPDTTLHFRRFTGGLYLSADDTDMPPGTVRRNRGLKPFASGLFQSRDGSTQLHAVNAAHSLIYFNDKWYSGVSTSFYQGLQVIKTGLSGDRLSFARMPPTAGVRDQLFIAGGDELVKVDQGDLSLVSSTYIWTAGGGGTNEYYLTDPEGGDPGIDEPAVVIEDGTEMTVGTMDSLAAGEWDWGDSDTLGFSTVYVRLTDNSDPDSQADDYLTAGYVTSWGIENPFTPPTPATGVAGNLTGVYKYNITYLNSLTGTRSNPAPIGPNTIKLLLHCDGADQHVNFTDSGPKSHTVSVVEQAKGVTAQKKFGTASLVCDGTGDRLTIPAHVSLAMKEENFCVDLQVRFNALATSTRYGLFGQKQNSANLVYLTLIINGSDVQTLVFSLDVGGVTTHLYATTTFVVNTWYHIAVIRGWAGDKRRYALTVDGTAVDTFRRPGAIDNWPNFGSTFSIGRGLDSNGVWYEFNGWIDEFRIVKKDPCWTSNFTAPTAAHPVTNAVTAASDVVDLTAIPPSLDSQVDTIEIWRTFADSSIYFLLDTISAVQTTYTDDIVDADLESVELPTDNLKPFDWFDDCFGPYNASMFWLTRTEPGERGRVYYSPIGRAEAVQGFIELTGDDTPLKTGFMWGGTVFVVGEDGMYQIAGINPYFSRRMSGIPGTNNPHTVVVTPIGVMYEAEDGVRIFNGSTSELASVENVQQLFRGETGGALTAFSGVIAAYGRGEYFISDETQLIAFDVRKKSWRDVGDLSVKSLAYAEDADIIGAGTNADGIYDLENEGDTDDNSNNIEIDLETQHIRLGDDAGGTVKHVHIDHVCGDAGGETLTVYLEHDGSETNLGTASQGTTRGVDTLQVNRICKEFGIRITGSIDDWIKIYSISADVFTREEETR